MIKLIFLVLSFYSTFALSDDIDCTKAISTIDINYCAGVKLVNAEKIMNEYLSESKKHNSNDPELIKSIEEAQKAWGLYADAHCDSIYSMWREGTIRGVMGLNCQTKLTKARTHEIWENFLTYMDSTPPVLPEPSL